MPLVTLIGEKLAKIDEEFIYLGPQNDCRNCKLKTVCFNLKVGRRYKITNRRDKKHSCKLHDGAAAVVEVQELDIITCVDCKYGEGDKVKINENKCKNIGCKFYDLCIVPETKNKEYKISKIVENIDCPIGLKIQKVELTD